VTGFRTFNSACIPQETSYEESGIQTDKDKQLPQILFIVPFFKL
jgi:hypothetical protein